MRKVLSFILAMLMLFAASAAYAVNAEEERLPICVFSSQGAKLPAGLSALSAWQICLEPMESVYVSDSEGRSMFNTLRGRTVAEVIANKAKLIDYGVNEEDVNNAEDATVRLVKVLTPYSKLKAGREKFDYYKEHYKEIRNQFMRLYKALYSLLGSSLVRMELTKKEKLGRYCQFVAQLYVIAMALDDTVTFSPDWRVRGNNGESVVMYKPSDLLESVQLVTDRDAANPARVTYTVLYGDIYVDGYVNKKDSLALRKYLADPSYPIDLEAADVYRDGAVNKKDSLRLKRYLAGWDSQLGV